MKMMNEFFLSWGMLVLSVAFNAVGAFIIKMRLNELGPMKMESIRSTVSYCLNVLQSPLVVFGVVIFFLAPFVFAVALSRMEISIAYPAQVGLNFIFVLLLALLFLGEQMTLLKIIGITAVLIGVVCLVKANG